jgi:hypothetical protein
MNDQPKSNLFLIRLWTDDSGPGAPWQGRIQPIGEGRAASFSDWSTLQRILVDILESHGEKEPEHSSKEYGSHLPLHISPFQ